MTIASAAFAAVPSFHAHAAQPLAEADGESGSLFAKQLRGLTAGLPDADAWRSGGPVKAQTSSEPQSNIKEAPALALAAAEKTGDLLTQVNIPEPAEVSGKTDAPAPTGKATKPQKKTDDDAPATTVTAPIVIQPDTTFGLWHVAKSQKDADAPAAEIQPVRTRGAHTDAHQPTPSAPNIDAAQNTLWTTAAATEQLALPVTTANPSTDTTPIVETQPAKPPASHSEPAEPVKPATPTVTAAAGSPQNSRELAFATRVQPVQNTSQSSLPAEMAAAAAVASASKKVATEMATASPSDVHALPADSVTIADRNMLQSAPAAATPAAQPAEMPEPQSLPKAPATPLKDISLQVSQPGADPVAVRVVQEGSQVHVSVHSGDATLTSGLRQGLSELQSRLEESGYRSEMWKPTPAVAAPTAPSTAQEPQNHSRGGDQPSHQGGSQQESGRRNQNQSNQPRWVEELEASTAGGDKTSGGFYGFSS